MKAFLHSLQQDVQKSNVNETIQPHPSYLLDGNIAVDNAQMGYQENLGGQRVSGHALEDLNPQSLTSGNSHAISEDDLKKIWVSTLVVSSCWLLRDY